MRMRDRSTSSFMIALTATTLACSQPSPRTTRIEPIAPTRCACFRQSDTPTFYACDHVTIRSNPDCRFACPPIGTADCKCPSPPDVNLCGVSERDAVSESAGSVAFMRVEPHTPYQSDGVVLSRILRVEPQAVRQLDLDRRRHEAGHRRALARYDSRRRFRPAAAARRAHDRERGQGGDDGDGRFDAGRGREDVARPARPRVTSLLIRSTSASWNRSLHGSLGNCRRARAITRSRRAASACTRWCGDPRPRPRS